MDALSNRLDAINVGALGSDDHAVTNAQLGHYRAQAAEQHPRIRSRSMYSSSGIIPITAATSFATKNTQSA